MLDNSTYILLITGILFGGIIGFFIGMGMTEYDISSTICRKAYIGTEAYLKCKNMDVYKVIKEVKINE